MDISIITVTWNSRAVIATQIESVREAATGLDFEQIVVDNASTDGTVGLVRQRFPEVTVIPNSTNNGFGRANNQALAVASGAFLLFLNPDMRLTSGSLATLIDWLKNHPHVGIVSPQLTDEHGVVKVDARPRRFPRLRDQLAIIFKLPHVFPRITGRYLMADFDPAREQEVDSVRGSCMLVRRGLIEKLGWIFDPRYFVWFEDVDTCREAKRLGYGVVYTPVVSAVDFVGQSFKQQPTLWRQQQFTASMLTYFKKWQPWYVWLFIATARPLGLALTWLAVKIQKIRE